MNIIIECKIPDYDDTEEYEIEVQNECPHCEWCKRDMEYDCYIGAAHTEIWHCPKCGEIEECYPNDYGSTFIKMNEQEYQDYKANERQEARLRWRYGTPKPRSIRDYWQK